MIRLLYYLSNGFSKVRDVLDRRFEVLRCRRLVPPALDQVMSDPINYDETLVPTLQTAAALLTKSNSTLYVF